MLGPSWPGHDAAIVQAYSEYPVYTVSDLGIIEIFYLLFPITYFPF